jgi:hypothetical protein
MWFVITDTTLPGVAPGTPTHINTGLNIPPPPAHINTGLNIPPPPIIELPQRAIIPSPNRIPQQQEYLTTENQNAHAPNMSYPSFMPYENQEQPRLQPMNPLMPEPVRPFPEQDLYQPRNVTMGIPMDQKKAEFQAYQPKDLQQESIGVIYLPSQS